MYQFCETELSKENVSLLNQQLLDTTMCVKYSIIKIQRYI